MQLLNDLLVLVLVIAVVGYAIDSTKYLSERNDHEKH